MHGDASWLRPALKGGPDKDFCEKASGCLAQVLDVGGGVPIPAEDAEDPLDEERRFDEALTPE
jgi:hypothetical protein